MGSKDPKITFEGLFCAQMKDFYDRLKNEKAYLPSYVSSYHKRALFDTVNHVPFYIDGV